MPLSSVVRCSLFAVTVAASALLPTSSSAAQKALDPQPVRYAQALYIGQPTRFSTASGKRIDPLHRKALAHFQGRTALSIRRELEPYLKVLRPGTFGFTAVAYALAYYTSPRDNPSRSSYDWHSYVRWSTPPEFGFPQPEKDPIPNLLPMPLDEGQTVDRAMVRLFRRHPNGSVLRQFFELQYSDGGTDPYLEAALMLLNENPTLVMDEAGSNEKAMRTLTWALTYREFGGEMLSRPMALVQKVAEGPDASAAEGARTLLERVAEARRAG